MASTLLLDRTAWDLVIDANGNIAAAAEPYSLAQDAASAIKTFLGECWWDVTVGVPYLSQILARNPPLSLLKRAMEQAALTVVGVTSATCFISAVTDRVVAGQVQVTSATGETSVASFAAPFAVVSPQGTG